MAGGGGAAWGLAGVTRPPRRPISLTVAKCWDPSPRSYFTIPRADPVRPIDPAAWLSHTAALTGALPRYELEEAPLTVKSDMGAVVRVMQLPDSGLEIRDRMWLKITIANAVIGADVVDWLYTHLEGFRERREARRSRSPEPQQRLQWSLRSGHAGPVAPPGCPLAPGPGLPLPVPGAPALLPTRVPGPWLQLRQRQRWEPAE